MGLPLSRLPEPDSEVAHLIPFPDDRADRHPVDADTWWGVLCLMATGLACAAGVYGTSYLADYAPVAPVTLYMIDALVSACIGALVVRRGIANPWYRKYRRWIGRYEDWKLQSRLDKARLNQALQDLARLDAAACAFTGEGDPAAARRLLLERLKRMKPVKRTGRPRHSPTGISRDKWLEIAEDIRRRRDKEWGTWDAIGGLHGISGDTARKWYQWLDEEEQEDAG